MTGLLTQVFRHGQLIAHAHVVEQRSAGSKHMLMSQLSANGNEQHFTLYTQACCPYQRGQAIGNGLPGSLPAGQVMSCLSVKPRNWVAKPGTSGMIDNRSRDKLHCRTILARLPCCLSA